MHSLGKPSPAFVGGGFLVAGNGHELAGGGKPRRCNDRRIEGKILIRGPS
jgi:hypothetical protein